MEVLNDSTVLPLSEIVVKLFNNSFLSDINFSVDEKNIRAHSFILMSRSTVYQQQFESNQGQQKLIPIQNYDFATFYQFVRFIYTDECSITKENIVELSELAGTHNIKKLSELISDYIEKVFSTQEKFRLYELCVANQHQELGNIIEVFVAKDLYQILDSDYFLQCKPMVVEKILKLEFVGTTSKPVQETDILYAVIKWIHVHSFLNGIKVSEKRMKFDKLIRLIRFPVIEPTFRYLVAKQSENLFSDSDILSFFNPPGRELFISEVRKSYVETNEVDKVGKWFDGLNVNGGGESEQRGWRRWWKRWVDRGHGPRPTFEHGRCGEVRPDDDSNTIYHHMRRIGVLHKHLNL